ncbi:peroxisomal biogenesis factor 11-domain-containing protein [Zychaea mexicana]|uniref:peroxisomal biogenesis factor 11-domain-containing protein n=1 Tax=Zychaea mexicana TaxID=64656 RepID=UPI0022FDD228|nr:peroxisomal biogenesis factor 11-domain-containing protein [Zychaea mexicana]KAI9497950.1 peroxisomal biogenesis factor 11-domain-containing protein [Zychaea mexicana]
MFYDDDKPLPSCFYFYEINIEMRIMQKQDITWTILVLCSYCSCPAVDERATAEIGTALNETNWSNSAEHEHQQLQPSFIKTTNNNNNNNNTFPLVLLLIVCLSFLLSLMSTLSPLDSIPTPAASPPRSVSPTTMTNEKPFVMPLDTTTTSITIQLSKSRRFNRFIQTLQKFLKELDGRDKSIKFFQYLFKILLHYKLVHAKTWSPMVSQFSMTRKILRLGLFIAPARQLLYDNNKTDLVASCFLLNELGNTVADDIFCLYKLGLVSSKLGKQAEVVACYCWFAGILHDVHENWMTLRQLRQKQVVDDEKMFNTQLSIVKLSMDGVFCACDIWQPSFASGVQAWSGFFSGTLSGYKLWRKIAAA